MKYTQVLTINLTAISCRWDPSLYREQSCTALNVRRLWWYLPRATSYLYVTILLRNERKKSHQNSGIMKVEVAKRSRAITPRAAPSLPIALPMNLMWRSAGGRRLLIACNRTVAGALASLSSREIRSLAEDSGGEEVGLTGERYSWICCTN